MLEEIVDNEGNVVSTRKKNFLSISGINDVYYNYASSLYKKSAHVVKKTFFTLLASSIALSPLVIGGELYFRNVARQEKPWLITKNQKKDINSRDMGMRTHIPGLSYINFPNMNKENLEYNSWGYHDDEFVVPKSDNIFRIAIVGDSMTYGSAVKKEQTFANRLEQILNKEKIGKKKFDVVNLGVCGHQALEVYSTMRTIAIPLLDPDLIIYAFFGNDFLQTDINYYRYFIYYENYSKDWGNMPRHIGLNISKKLEFLLKSNSALYSEISYRSGILRYEKILPSVKAINKFIDNEWVKLAFMNSLSLAPYLYPAIETNPDYEFTYEAIRNMNNLAKKNNINFMITVLPIFECFKKPRVSEPRDVFSNYWNLISDNFTLQVYRTDNYLIKKMEKNGLCYMDLQATRVDGHPSVLGHKLLAESLYDYLMHHNQLLQKQ